jgi:hypothetical protein
VDVHGMLKSVKMEKDRILKLPLVVDTAETGCASSADQRVGMISVMSIYDQSKTIVVRQTKTRIAG